MRFSRAFRTTRRLQKSLCVVFFKVTDKVLTDALL